MIMTAVKLASRQMLTVNSSWTLWNKSGTVNYFSFAHSFIAHHILFYYQSEFLLLCSRVYAHYDN